LNDSKLQPAQRIGKQWQNAVPTTVGGLSMLRKILPLYLRNQEERVPRTPLGPFRTDPAAYSTPPSTGLRITWMGHSTLLIELDGYRILTDPVWDQRASPVQWAGPRRFFPAPLALDDLPPLDAVLLSHDHYDHLGAGTVRALARLGKARRWITSLGVGAILQRLGVPADRITELNWTQATTDILGGPGLTRTLDGPLCITALPARHFSGRSLRNRFHTLWSSFSIAGPHHRVYFGADSGLWPGLEAIGRDYGPFDLTMLDTGAWHPLWEQIHMGPDGAVAAWQRMGGQGLLMPIHWALFDLALHAWRFPIERITALAAEHGIPLWSPVPGEPTEVVRDTPLQTRWWQR
jgi:L-ascorbate metabolism protein UlaG (beta-lactamase superfamily)